MDAGYFAGRARRNDASIELVDEALVAVRIGGPPTSLTVAARKIEGWELLADPDKPKQKFTPPLPEVSPANVSRILERLTLVPYCSTELRVTIFPQVG